MSLRVVLFTVFVSLAASYAWGFGPHGDGKIGGDVNTSIIPGGIPILQNIKLQTFRVPVSYPSLSRRDLVPIEEVIDVEGKSSMLNFTIPLSVLGVAAPFLSLSADFGDRGVQEAIADAKDRYGVRDVYDVRIDRKRFSVFCIVVICAYSKITTVVHAKGVVENAGYARSFNPSE